MMKKLISLMLAAVMVLSLLGCVAEDTPYVPSGDALAAEDADLNATEPEISDEAQEFTLAYYEDRSLNPYTCGDYTNRTLFSLIYQGLFSVSRDYTAVPILCNAYRMSDDYKIFTFFLADATFSDGSPLTVDDVLASFEAAKESDYYGGRFTHVSSIVPSDDGGITFFLNTPVEEFILLLDVPIVKASQVDAESPLGTGPYILEDALTGAQLRRNNAWWCKDAVSDLAATASSIPLIAADSPTTIRDEFEFGDVGLVCADPCADNYADYRCDYELWECENGIFLFLSCNVAYSQNEIFEDPDLRKMLTYAIDRETLAEEYYEGFGRATTLAMSPQSPNYPVGLASKYEYDPVRFINAVSGTRTDEPLRLLVNSDDSLRLKVARAIAEMFTDCGLETVTVEVNSRSFHNEIVKGAYDLYLGATRLSSNMDLSPFFKPYQELSRNGVSDATLYSLCLDAMENQGNFYNLHKAVADDGRIVPVMFCSYAVYAERGLLTKLQPSRDNVFFYTLGRGESDVLVPDDYDPDAVG